jgi:hypothetical protein
VKVAVNVQAVTGTHYGGARHGYDAHAEQARDLFRAGDDPTGYATALNNIGWNLIHLDRHTEAITCCEEALAVCGPRWPVRRCGRRTVPRRSAPS